ncbi:MAG: hypothetical protein AAB605_01680 [Patescibacteria group bacterium]
MLRSIFLVALFLPGLAFAAPQTFEQLAGIFVQILNGGIGVAIVLGIVIYFLGIATSLGKLKSGGTENLRTHLLWGMIALFVMISVWGILALLRNTLFGGGAPDFSGGGGTVILCQSAVDCLVAE